MAQKINRPTLFGFGVQTLSQVEPRVDWFPVDPTSAQVRWGDPVKQVAGGIIQRCTPATTTILGICAAGANDVLPSAIAHPPFRQDSAGRTMVPVYLADALTIFTGATNIAPAQTHVLQLHDLQYAVPDASAPTATIANVGTTGSTSYTYNITVGTAVGETVIGADSTTSTGNATLSATNYNTVTIPAVTRAQYFNVYRAGVLIASVPAAASGTTVINDTGLPALVGTAPTANMSGWLVNLSASSTAVAEVRSIDTKPTMPFISTNNVGAVLFAIPAAKSQVQNIAGS